jgi:AcrR family transcriptional regulator
VTGSDTGARPEPARPGLRERKKAQTRETIRSCALLLIREQGYDATTIEQIIEAADVSETTFFRYFPTKEDVVLDPAYDTMLLEAFRAQPAEATPVQALRAAFAAVFADRSDAERASQREWITLMLTVPRLRSARIGRGKQVMRMIIAAMAERAGRRRDDPAVRTIVGAVLGAAVAVSTAVRDDPDVDLAALIDEAIARLEPGLGL